MGGHDLVENSGRRRRRKFLGVTLVAVVGAFLLGFPGCSRRPYTCAVCRKDRVDHSCLGLNWTVEEDTECSRWYRSQVEPRHTHAWAKCSYCRRIGIPGLTGGYACVIGGPITGLSRTVQIKIYEHFHDRLEAKQLFTRLGRMDADCYRMWDALMTWVDAGYPATWHDWWEKHRGDVEE